MYYLRPCSLSATRTVGPLRKAWLSSRLYSTEAANDGPIRIEVGSSGAVTVDLFQPFSAIRPSAFIFYLPRGPVPFTSSQVPAEPVDLRPLAEAASAVVARVNYRISGNGHERYPLPIHDVASAWQWLFGLRMTQTPGQIGPRHLPPIGVCGEFIGGSLAAMLALTECHVKPFPGITAAYLGNPVADWTMMHSLEDISGQRSAEANHNGEGLKSFNRKKTKLKQEPSSWVANANAPELSSTKFLGLRHKLFADSSYWFDNFASPLLFFRTPSQAEPGKGSEEDEAFEAAMQAVTEEDEKPTGTDADVEALKAKHTKTRVAQRRWPPLRSGLVLPDTHITLGTESPVRDMGLDLAKSMNRSVFMHEQDKAGSLEDVTRATTENRAASGVWDGEEMVRMGAWFKENLKYD